MHTRFGARAFTLAAAFLLAGCGALSDYHSARTLAPGEAEVGFEASAFGGADADRVGEFLPGGAITSRHGIEDGFELGLRLGTMGAEVTGKWRLGAEDPDVMLATAPTVSGFILTGETWWAGLRVPLLIELPFGEGHGVVFSPRVQVQGFHTEGFLGGGGGGVVFNGGAGVALSLLLGPVVLVPEVSAGYPFYAVNVDGETADESAPLILQGGVGLRWRFGG